jgi:periplasmic copper chaperone A
VLCGLHGHKLALRFDQEFPFMLSPTFHSIYRRCASFTFGAALAVAPTLPSSAFAHDFKKGSLTIDHPTVSPTRGTVAVNAGYLTIINAGATPDRLVSASSPDAARVEMHDHVRSSSGMMQMRQVQGGVTVPARGRVAFVQGGLHLMIYSPKAPLRDGGYFSITLNFERAGSIDVVAMVEAPSPTAKRHSH